MAHQSQHCTDCQRLLGQTFAPVHAFLDQYATKYGGLGHRLLLHHRRGVELVAKRFGEEARPAAELHIIRDLLPAADLGGWETLLDQIPADWQEYGEPVFLDLAHYDQMERDLKELFG